MQIINVQYGSVENGFGGREYSYYADFEVEVDEIILVPIKNGLGAARVTQTGVNPESIPERVRDYIRTIERLEYADSPQDSGEVRWEDL